MTDEEREQWKRRVRDLEALTMDLRVKNQQLETRLRIAELLEPPRLSLVDGDGFSLRVVQ